MTDTLYTETMIALFEAMEVESWHNTPYQDFTEALYVQIANITFKAKMGKGY